MKLLLPKTITQKLYIVATRTRLYEPDQTFQYQVKLRTYSPEMGDNTEGAVLLGTHEVTVGIPQINPLQSEVEALEKLRTSILAEAQSKANKISEHIQQLLCIAHDKE